MAPLAERQAIVLTHERWDADLERLVRSLGAATVGKFAEFRDAEFLRALGLQRVAPRLRKFWPSRGPRWDALAVVRRADRDPGALLVEAKSHPGEVRGGGTRASPASLTKIHAALRATQEWVGATADPERWLGPLYQSANRLAHLYFLREVVGVDAWLVNLYFVDDPHAPTSRRAWERTIGTDAEELGADPAAHSGWRDFVGGAFLPARQRSELASRVA